MYDTMRAPAPKKKYQKFSCQRSATKSTFEKFIDSRWEIYWFYAEPFDSAPVDVSLLGYILL